jgi:hypothetical protein
MRRNVLKNFAATCLSERLKRALSALASEDDNGAMELDKLDREMAEQEKREKTLQHLRTQGRIALETSLFDRDEYDLLMSLTK